jgi:GNAT superfamily N-acetyltransferase
VKHEMRNALLELKPAEYDCPKSTLLKEANSVFTTAAGESFFKMVGFGRGTVAMADRSLGRELESFFASEDGVYCFDAPQLCALNDILGRHAYRPGEIFDTYLPTEAATTEVAYSGKATIRRLEREALSRLDWSHAIENAVTAPGPENKDKFAYLAEVDGKLAAIAGVSANYQRLWSVGVDTLPPFRGRGLASYLVSLVTHDVLKLGVIPIYSTWYSNLGSRATALRCGYRPGCVEIAATAITP